MIPLSPLNILKVVDLMSLVIPMPGLPLGWFPTNSFFPVIRLYFHLYLYILYSFLRTGHFAHYYGNCRSNSPSPLGLMNLACWGLEPSVCDICTLFLQSVTCAWSLKFLFCYLCGQLVTWQRFPLSLCSQIEKGSKNKTNNPNTVSLNLL